MEYSQFKMAIDMAFAAIGAGLTAFFGSTTGIFYALCAFAVIDYLSGVAVAIVKKKLSSRIGFKGLAKKALMFAFVGIANLIDVYVLGGSGATRTAVIFFYISNEGISIMENAVILGLPVPEVLRKRLELSGKTEDAGEKIPDETEKSPSDISPDGIPGKDGEGHNKD